MRGEASPPGRKTDGAGRLQVAGPGYELWRDILATNTESIGRALTAYTNELE
jgi:hypothetical protein